MKPPRADAQRNRDKLLATAETMFGKHGVSVSVEAIAREADVGIGTLYRHFPTKDALFAAIVIDRIERIAVQAEDLVGSPSPGAALFELVERMVANGGTKRDLIAALGSEWLQGAAVTAVKTRLRKALGKLLKRAQDAGEVRADVAVADVLALVQAVLAAGAKTRVLRIVLDGLSTRRGR